MANEDKKDFNAMLRDKKDMPKFQIITDPKSIEKYAKKAKAVKSVNILTNIGLSSFLLAYALPKAQFAFRKLVTGSDLEPGLAPAKKTIAG